MAAGQTVTVACKLPAGLCLDMPGKDRVIIKGNAFFKGETPDYPIQNGAALTFGVDKDFWDAWLNRNKELSVVRQRLVFAHEKDTAGQAKEFKEIKSGLERLDPDNPGKGLEKVSA
jgi:hypothetical protein